MQDVKTREKRLVYLDSARGLAAFRVMTWHFLVMFISRVDVNLLKNPLRIFYYGDSDIIFFFIHSGFILSYSYAHRLTAPDAASYFRFLIERFFRIFPLFIFLLVVSFVVQKYFYSFQPHLFFTVHSKNLWNETVSVRDVLQQAVLVILPESQSNKRLLPQDWTLSVEVIVGAMLPLLIFSIKRNVWLFFIVFFLLWQCCNTYVFEFGTGVFLFHFREEIQDYWNRTKTIYKVFLCCVTLVFDTCFFQYGSLFSSENIVYSYSIDRLIVNFGCVLLFIIIISSEKIQKVLSNKWLVWLGKICYSLYLWHVLLLIVFSAKVFSLLLPVFKQPFLALGVTFCLLIISTLLLSFFSFTFIEVPFNKLGKKLSRSLS